VFLLCLFWGPRFFLSCEGGGWGLGAVGKEGGEVPFAGVAQGYSGAVWQLGWLHSLLSAFVRGLQKWGGRPPSWGSAPWQTGCWRHGGGETPLGPALTAELGWSLRNQNCCVIATLQLLPG
jgi:hypothetical protein